MNSQKQLAVTLSRLASFEKPSLRLEQYPTDSEVAAEIIWWAQQTGDISGKTIADFGCGTGILGIGCLFFEPKKVSFVDIDPYALKRLDENLKLNEFDNYEILNLPVEKFEEKVDVVIQNPPFGTRTEHADKLFLEKAFVTAEVIYSLHKTTSQKFIEQISKDNGFKITNYFKFDFPLKQSHSFHSRKIHRIDVGCWRMQKNLQ